MWCDDENVVFGGVGMLELRRAKEECTSLRDGDYEPEDGSFLKVVCLLLRCKHGHWVDLHVSRQPRQHLCCCTC